MTCEQNRVKAHSQYLVGIPKKYAFLKTHTCLEQELHTKMLVWITPKLK